MFSGDVVPKVLLISSDLMSRLIVSEFCRGPNTRDSLLMKISASSEAAIATFLLSSEFDPFLYGASGDGSSLEYFCLDYFGASSMTRGGKF